jgi:two-component system, LuxR family, sensor kinase FixL
MSQLGTASVAMPGGGNTGNDIAPAMLIRTLQGHITLWSPAMELRYGFSAGEALGRVAHELLRTVLVKPQGEIEAELVQRKSWSGGFIHRRADGRLVMSAHHWHLHQPTDDDEPLLSELHTDIAIADEHTATVLADIIGVISHELSQPLSAITSYIDGANRALQPAWPDKVSSSQALTAAMQQIERVKEGMALFRELGQSLRQHRAEQGERSEFVSLPSEPMEADNR